MQRIWAIAKLTWKAAFRFRLFWVLAVLLLGSVIGLPLILKSDQTARGFVQLVLTYNLSVITMLLGLATLWLSCGTLARDIEDCQMQMIAVKPIARWQIWLGKWLGIVLLDAALLALTGGSVYLLLQWRASRLPADQQAILHHEIFVARGALKEPMPDIDKYVDAVFQKRIQETEVPPDQYPLLRKQLTEQVKAGFQIVPPGFQRVWTLPLGLRKNSLHNDPLYLRANFHVAQTNESGLYQGEWQIGVPGKTQVVVDRQSMSANTFHEFAIPPNLFDENGVLTVSFINRNPTALLFPLEDGFEVLYREGGFALNFARGLMIILFWMALLAALGLASASLLSFPVAAFFSLSLLVVSLSTGTLSTVVEEGTVVGADHETGVSGGSWVDVIMVPFFKVLLRIVNLVRVFSPVDALSTGRSITWGTLGIAFAQVVLLLGGIFAVVGIIIFTRRELATAQSTT